MGTLKGDSRLRIVEILKRRGQASVTELSEALELTPVTVRHHLEMLMDDQVVAAPVPRRKPGPGRPEMVYALTDQADHLTPRNYGEMCACLLQAVGGGTPAGRPLLRAAGTRLADGAEPPLALAGVVEFLDARGYYPTVELGEAGTTIVLASCPYLEVARAHPEICQFDLGLLERLLGEAVVPESSIALRDSSCRLRLASTV